MPTSPRLLAIRHRVDAIRIGNALIRSITSSAQHADTRNIDEWWAGYEDVAARHVRRTFQVSAELGVDFLSAHSRASGVDLDVYKPALWVPERAATSLRVTGPVAFKTAVARTRNPVLARSTMVARLARSAQRLGLMGGRNTIALTSQASKQITGYERVSDGDPCDYCDGLVGTVFGPDKDDFDAHDGDGCSLEPVY